MGIDNNFDPDLLLADLQSASKKNSSQGQLRVFLGMCPGVGKTFSMLRAANERKKEGFDIVVGIVETHERKETLNEISNLEIVPRKKIKYKETILEDMDIDAIILRKPQIVLVDELAHSNAPGCRLLKRYQDVEELLNAGINVYTTVNIQHIETRSELVTKITGIEIKETVPDSVVSNAYQVELIDLNPDELIKRLNDGKVYIGERAVNALNNFFKIEHLIALRELALRFTAEIVDKHLRSEMSIKGIKGAWHTSDRIMVAISHSPYSPKLLRSARRKAQTLEASWIALYVENGIHLSDEDKSQLNKNIKLAKDLGAEFISVYDDDVANAIKRISLQRNVSQIIIGRPDRRFSDVIKRGTLLDKLTYDLTDVDILILKQEKRSKRSLQFKLRKLFEIHSGIQSYYNAITIILVTSLALHFVREIVGYRSIGFFYLLIVLFVSSVAGKGVIFFSALISALVWNFFFIPPFGTFHIEQKEDIMLFSTFFVVAVVTGYLSSEKRKKQDVLIEREERTNLLYETSKNLSKSNDANEIVNVCKTSVKRLLFLELEMYLVESDDEFSINKNSHKISLFSLSDSERAVVLWSLKNKVKAGFSTETLSSSTIQSIPISTTLKNYAVLVLRRDKKKSISHLNENLIDTIIQLVAESLEKIHYHNEAKMTALLKESEKLHQALFNSISHEMKTPITAIIGTSSTMLEDTFVNSDLELKRNLENIKESSYRLNRVVVNLLDMSRLSGGINKLQLEFFELKEFLENLKSSYFKDRDVDFVFPIEEVYLNADAKLLEHAFINLIQNSIQYSQNDSSVLVSIYSEKNKVRIEVKDKGIGIPAGEESKIFERFYRSSNVKTGGTGLGLSIVKEVLTLHGGSIFAINNSDCGACFKVTLPKIERKFE